MSRVRVIGVVGKNGSGKDEVLKYLRAKYNVPFVATGDIVREIAASEGVEPTRDNLGKISRRYFSKFGRGYFVKQAAEKIKKSGWGIAGISGIRSLDDVVAMEDIFGEDFILIRVVISDPRVRFSRMKNRAAERDPASYDEFLRLDNEEEKIFRIEEAEKRAKYSLSNNGTLEALHAEIEKLAADKGLLEDGG